MPFQRGHRLTPEKYVDGYEDEFVTIKKRIENTRRPCGEAVRNYICVCKECGKEFTASHSLINTHSAGFCKECKKKNRKLSNNKYYGTRIYSIWYSMKCRCYYEKHPCYNNYGGRGITVCDEWRYNSIAFGDWAVANGYRDDLTIDRINVNCNYEPSNCRWATRKEQADNKREYTIGETGKRNGRSKALIEINGESKTREEWCDFYGISRKTVEKRIYQLKWGVVKAITTPPRKRGS